MTEMSPLTPSLSPGGEGKSKNLSHRGRGWKERCLVIWTLMIGGYLEFGVWLLEFDIIYA